MRNSICSQPQSNGQALLVDLLCGFIPLDSEEQLCRERFINFVKNEPLCLSRELLKGHITVSAWLLDTTLSNVLLTHHKKLNLWIQLGGHADEDGDLRRVALKEANEESGLSDLEFVVPSIFDLAIHQVPKFGDVPHHLHYDVRFIVKATKSNQYKISNESFDLKWVNLHKIGNFTNDPSLLRMAQKTLSLIT